MNSILDRYGIKEVADVTFYDLDNNGNPTVPVLYLDTLKVSTIEQTAEETEATGGKGNAALVAWDYGKEITVTLEDALFSAKSMAIMFGNGRTKSYKTVDDNKAYIMKTEQFVAKALTGSILPTEATSLTDAKEVAGWNQAFEGPDGTRYIKINPTFYDENGVLVGTETKAATDNAPATVKWTAEQKYFCTYDLVADAVVIEISANSFPGTYYVTGDTYARNEASGKDEFFQFIIPKAKVQSENTITLEAEGDPSVFNMNLKVMRPADGKMMKLVPYGLKNGTTSSESLATTLIHNHDLLGGTKEEARG